MLDQGGCWILGCWIYQGATEEREARLPLHETRTPDNFPSLNSYNKSTMTAKYGPKKDLNDSAINAAWLTGGIGIVNFSHLKHSGQDRFLATPSKTLESCMLGW